MTKLSSIWKTLGPGFLYAGAAVGVSHLVQSTKAGAAYGYTLLFVVLLSNVFKYPFFEAGPRYAAATGENLIQGYQRIGKWAVWLFTLLTASTAFIIQSAVTIVTAALFANLLSIKLSGFAASFILLLLCSLVLLVGKYNWLDSLVKWVVILLSVASIIAFFRAQSIHTEVNLWPDWLLDKGSFLFLFALMGWMPAPLDIATWHSIWTVEKKKSNQGNLNLRDALRDFHIGYWGTAVLALIFVSLGALVLFASNQSLSGLSGAQFSQKFVSIYTDTLGAWTYPIIAFAAFATMFSTTITVLDGAPRVADALVPVLRSRPNNQSAVVYKVSVLLIALGALLIIGLVTNGNVFSTLVNVATIASFLTAPLLAFLNYKLVFSRHMPAEAKPGIFNKVVAMTGLVLLSLFALLYLAYLLGIIHFN
ncbi:divalent metal cation transporter [bacterium]|nr:divalent metal cation transporter [bacterium]